MVWRSVVLLCGRFVMSNLTVASSCGPLSARQHDRQACSGELSRVPFERDGSCLLHLEWTSSQVSTSRHEKRRPVGAGRLESQ